VKIEEFPAIKTQLKILKDIPGLIALHDKNNDIVPGKYTIRYVFYSEKGPLRFFFRTEVDLAFYNAYTKEVIKTRNDHTTQKFNGGDCNIYLPNSLLIEERDLLVYHTISILPRGQ